MNTDLSGATAGVDALSSVSLSTPDIGSGINFTAAGQPAYQSVTAQSGDSISTILGTSDPGAIGQFERINGLTSSTINAGTSYLVPTDLSNVTDADEALGQASLNTDNARLAQIGAQQSALAGSVPYYLNPDSAGPAVPPTPESPSLLGRAIQWLGSNQTVDASIDDVNLNDTAPSASGFFRGVVDVNVAGTLSGLAGAAVSAGNNPEAALYLDPAEAAAESQEIQTSANATQQSVYNALALGPGTPDQLANYQIGTYTAEGANLALGAYGLVRGGFALAGLSSGEALEPLAANATNNILQLPKATTSGLTQIPMIPGQTTTVIGAFDPDMQMVLNTLGAPKLDGPVADIVNGFSAGNPGGINVLDVSDDVYNTAKAQGGFFTNVNGPWVDAAAARGDIVYVASSPDYIFNATGDISGFGKEFQRFLGLGYTASEDGMMLHPPLLPSE